MASVFKPAGAKKYVILYVDDTGRRRKKTGATDKAVSERIARDIENRVALRREGVVDAKTEALVAHEARPLADHLADWRAGMLARGKTARHADQYHTRAARVVVLSRGARLDDIDPPGRKPEARARAARALADALKAARLSDLAPDRIQAALAQLRQAGKSNQTVNHHRAALRAFARWCGDNGRLRDNPMRGVKGFNVAEDPHHPRRALTPDEAARVIQAAERGRVVRRMTGPDRARLYDLALGTGFRAEELASLTPERFDLDDDPPTATVSAAYTKNGKEAVQPLPAALAARLAPWLATLPPGRPIFDPMPTKTAELIRADLAAAGIPYETSEGVADFHALRAAYVSNLVASGASVKTCQVLARHSSPSLTIGVYAKASVHDIRGAVDALPDPTADRPIPEAVALAATGTEGKTVPRATENATLYLIDPAQGEAGTGTSDITAEVYKTSTAGSNPAGASGRLRPSVAASGRQFEACGFPCRARAIPPVSDSRRLDPSPSVGTGWGTRTLMCPSVPVARAASDSGATPMGNRGNRSKAPSTSNTVICE